MLYLFLFHIDFTVCAYHVFYKKKTVFKKRYRTLYNDLDTFGPDSVIR